MIRDRLVLGSTDNRSRARLMRKEEACSLKVAIDELRVSEITNRQLKEIDGKSDHQVNYANKKNTKPKKPKESEQKSQKFKQKSHRDSPKKEDSSPKKEDCMFLVARNTREENVLHLVISVKSVTECITLAVYVLQRSLSSR